MVGTSQAREGRGAVPVLSAWDGKDGGGCMLASQLAETSIFTPFKGQNIRLKFKQTESGRLFGAQWDLLSADWSREALRLGTILCLSNGCFLTWTRMQLRFFQAGINDWILFS